MIKNVVSKPNDSLAFKQLKEQLREMFQLDRGDLDFGIYRVMNQKREDVTKFLDEQLLPQVREVLDAYQPAGMAGAQDELNKMTASLKDAGVDPETSPKVQELREKLAQSVDVGKLENEIYSDLYNFFKRYYSDGDFMSMRRYKEGVYALPYEGEEVKLHWANHDQYYIKTSENLKNFTFKTANDKRVRFEVVAGGTETNNNKAQEGKERRFILHADAPTEVNGDELIIRFEYRPDANKRKQDALNQETIEALSPLAEIANAGLLELAPTEKKKGRTLLEKYLTEYTAKFSFDYFIHKDLGKFLRRELDFYIKNEIFHLDDIENENAPKVESYLGKVKAMRQVAGKIIQFLAQLEDFQKKLWLKKKFVLETNYCVTLDYIIDSDVADELLPIIAENAEQNAEWVKLFAIDDLDGYAELLSVDFLKENAKLLVDTKFFDVDFKYAVLSIFDNLDSQTDGLLINSENFQALSFLQNRYVSKLDGVYIDPPYNTDASAILYKNNYKDSSWLSLMHNRLCQAHDLLKVDGSICVAIDDEEVSKLVLLLENIFPKTIGIAPVRSNPAGRKTKGRLAPAHEYALFYGKSEKSNPGYLELTDKRLSRYPHKEEKGRFAWANFIRSGTNDKRADRPKMHYPIAVHSNNTFRIPEIKWNAARNRYDVLEQLDDTETLVYPISPDGTAKRWQRGYERFSKELDQYKVSRSKDDDQRITIHFKTFMDEESMPTTWWDKKDYASANYGASELKGFFKENPFDFPKAHKLVQDCLRVINLKNNGTVIDFFAGSGTTAHATNSLKRSEEINCRYILVEMGKYFSDVTLPRSLKSAYSSQWSAGKPTKIDGLSQLIKYISIEQYEDSLDNLTLSKTALQTGLLRENLSLNEQYMLGYMMEMESKGSPSLLNTDSFADPFAYQLRVTRDDDTKIVNVDLVETFNYLLGLNVRTVDRDKNGIVTIVGTNSLGENCLIIWRNVNDVDNDALETWFGKRYSSKDFEFDAIYVNGDNNIENLKVDGDLWKVRLIEAEFSRLMFDVQDV